MSLSMLFVPLTAWVMMKARMKGGPRHKPTSLQVMVKGVERGLWPTPGAQDAKWRDTPNNIVKRQERGYQISLHGAVLLEQIGRWPTPSAND